MVITQTMYWHRSELYSKGNQVLYAHDKEGDGAKWTLLIHGARYIPSKLQATLACSAPIEF